MTEFLIRVAAWIFILGAVHLSGVDHPFWVGVLLVVGVALLEKAHEEERHD